MYSIKTKVKKEDVLQLQKLDNLETPVVGVIPHKFRREIQKDCSRTHNKIKALPRMSLAIYMRHIRLQKGKELLGFLELSIAEIAYKVGFKTPVYFSQVFKETFGESPNATSK